MQRTNAALCGELWAFPLLVGLGSVKRTELRAGCEARVGVRGGLGSPDEGLVWLLVAPDIGITATCVGVSSPMLGHRTLQPRTATAESGSLWVTDGGGGWAAIGSYLCFGAPPLL